MTGTVRKRAAIACLAISFTFSPYLTAHAQDDKATADTSQTNKGKTPPPADKSATDKQALPPLPADAHVSQTIQLDGKTLHYNIRSSRKSPCATQTEKLPATWCAPRTLFDQPDRPVTFALNGGPGASSVYLNFGAIGPKHLNFANEGESPSEIPTLTDNPGTWLGFTDLVFIDPIGTGYSRSLVPEDQTREDFYSTEPDIHYLSQVMLRTGWQKIIV